MPGFAAVRRSAHYQLRTLPRMPTWRRPLRGGAAVVAGGVVAGVVVAGAVPGVPAGAVVAAPAAGVAAAAGAAGAPTAAMVAAVTTPFPSRVRVIGLVTPKPAQLRFPNAADARAARKVNRLVPVAGSGVCPPAKTAWPAKTRRMPIGLLKKLVQ